MSRSILHICLSRGCGGLEMYPSRVAPGLAARGWNVYGLALSGTRVAEALHRECLEVLTFPSANNAILHLWRIKRWIVRHGITVIHCHKSSDLRLAAMLKMVLPSLYVVFTEHMGVSKPKHDLYHRWAYSKVDQVLAISQETLRRNRKALPVPASRIALLYQGINLSHHLAAMDDGKRQQLRSELGILPEQVAVAVAARITPGKGQQTLVEAIHLLPGHSPVVGVLFGGLLASEGSNPEYVKLLQDQVERDGLENRVIFAGFRPDLSLCLEVMDIICVPSRNEAFGLSAIEGMAAGKPVIGSNSGALPEIIEGVGALVPADDPKAWSEVIQALAEAPDERQHLGMKGRKRVEERFRSDQHLDGLERVYRRETLEESLPD